MSGDRPRDRVREGRSPETRDWARSPSISPWRRPLEQRGVPEEVSVDCGWGRVIFAHTFRDVHHLADALRQEEEGRRDIAFYLPDPHVLISLGPQEFFLDPSHTYRLWLERYEPSPRRLRGFHVRTLDRPRDGEAIHALYRARQMVPPPAEFLWEERDDPRRTWFVAEADEGGRILGAVLGLDHVEAFADPEQGSSLWSLAVDPQAPQPGIGEALVRALAEHYRERGRAYVDLSVLHDNVEAIALYEKLGFERVPVFAVKRKNPINEPLFIAPAPEAEMNPYATLIVDEARRRGIQVEVLDAENAYFRLTMGGRTVTCRESLTELTSAIAMSRCDDKRVTHRVLAEAGLCLPAQRCAGTREENEAFLREHRRLVVKPRRGEQGAGVTVDLRTPEALGRAVRHARAAGGDVLLEAFHEGEDLRIIVIDEAVVAAAVRRPAEVTGTGRHTVRQLLAKQSRRRAAATGGESHIPVDAETRRCVEEAGYALASVLPENETIQVRGTANLHTGGTIHDVTERLHPALAEVAVRAAQALEIPVVGMDLLVPDVEGPDYVIVEANERPGLANHEPQPTAERFVDFLFPQSRRGAARRSEP